MLDPLLRDLFLGDVTKRQKYYRKVLRIQPASLIAYWRINELSGAVADNAEGTAARDGTIAGVLLGQPGIGDGSRVGSFDAVNDSVDVNTASFQNAFNGAEGTIAAWCRVRAASVWSDGGFRIIMRGRVDANNEWQLAKTGAGNLRLFKVNGGTAEDLQFAGHGSTTDFFHICMTWSEAADQHRGYFNGVEISGSPLTTLGTWVGVPVDRNIIGRELPSSGISWDGLLGHVPSWAAALTPAEALDLATV